MALNTSSWPCTLSSPITWSLIEQKKVEFRSWILMYHEHATSDIRNHHKNIFLFIYIKAKIRAFGLSSKNDWSSSPTPNNHTAVTERIALPILNISRWKDKKHFRSAFLTTTNGKNELRINGMICASMKVDHYWKWG